MKIYTNTIDLSKPMEKKFWVPPFSDFGIGVKFVNGDSAVEGDVTLKDRDGNTLTAEENKINGFTIYKMNSGEGEKTVVYTAVAPNGQETIIIQNVSDSTVFDTDETGGGGVPSDLNVNSIVVGDGTNNTSINSSKFESKIYDEDMVGSLTIESTVSPGFKITKIADGMQPATIMIDPSYPAIIIQGDGLVPGYWNTMAMFTPTLIKDYSGNMIWALACEHIGE